MSKINNNFAVILAQHKMKISQLSVLTGISRSTLTNLYYNRCKGISFETLNRLCSALECNVGDIIEINDNERGKVL